MMREIPWASFWQFGALAILVLVGRADSSAASACSSSPLGAVIERTGQSDVEVPDTDRAELSGIDFAGTDLYYAVGDDIAEAFPITIRIDPESGRLTGIATGRPLALRKADDL